MSLADVIKIRHRLTEEKFKEYLLFNHISVWIKNKLPEGFKLKSVFDYVESIIPINFVTNIDKILIGNFEQLEKRQITGLYMDRAVYLSNNQDNEDDMIDDIVHEISHAVEEQYQEFIYDDGLLEEEFLGKRNRLFFLLKGHDMNPNYHHFIDTEYSLEMDNYLYNTVGYEKMTNLVTNGLFLTPYSMTSLREYFAIGFEMYYLKGKHTEIQKCCPILYNKLEKLDMYSHEMERKTNIF